jgi:serine/threonine protein kinase
MHEYGYVHRDISTGNILLCQGHGKLSDLEYAKEMGTGDGREVRTVCFTNSSSAPCILTSVAQGTDYFMAIEIAIQRYLFLPDDTSRLPFYYNPLHDIESIWWITNYFMFHHFTEADHDRQTLRKDTDTLFLSNNDSLRRMTSFNPGTRYYQILPHLPVSFRTHGEKMNVCRRHLCSQHRRAESGASIDESAFDGTIHDLFTDTFIELLDSPASKQAIVATSQNNPYEGEGNTEADEDKARPLKGRKVESFDQTKIQKILEKRRAG